MSNVTISRAEYLRLKEESKIARILIEEQKGQIDKLNKALTYAYENGTFYTPIFDSLEKMIKATKEE